MHHKSQKFSIVSSTIILNGKLSSELTSENIYRRLAQTDQKCLHDRPPAVQISEKSAAE